MIQLIAFLSLSLTVDGLRILSYTPETPSAQFTEDGLCVNDEEGDGYSKKLLDEGTLKKIVNNISPWDRFAQHVIDHSTITVVVLGGSMTAGTGCVQKSKDCSMYKCAFSSRLHKFLQLKFPDKTIESA